MKTKNTGNVYVPNVGLRNAQFADVEDICELKNETNRAREARRAEARAGQRGWL